VARPHPVRRLGGSAGNLGMRAKIENSTTKTITVGSSKEFDVELVACPAP
jgi:hypothetical protein